MCLLQTAKFTCYTAIYFLSLLEESEAVDRHHAEHHHTRQVSSDDELLSGILDITRDNNNNNHETIYDIDAEDETSVARATSVLQTPPNVIEILRDDPHSLLSRIERLSGVDKEHLKLCKQKESEMQSLYNQRGDEALVFAGNLKTYRKGLQAKQQQLTKKKVENKEDKEITATLKQITEYDEKLSEFISGFEKNNVEYINQVLKPLHEDKNPNDNSFLFEVLKLLNPKEPPRHPETKKLKQLTDAEAKARTETSTACQLAVDSAEKTKTEIKQQSKKVEAAETIERKELEKVPGPESKQAQVHHAVEKIKQEELVAKTKQTEKKIQELESETKDRQKQAEISGAKAKKEEELETAGSSACFAGSAKVQTPSGPFLLSNLYIGDSVLTANGYEPLVGWLHAEQDVESFMLEIEIDSGAVLPITAGHMVFKSDGGAVPAGMVQPGDSLSSGLVIDVREVVRSDGIYAPLTKSGTIIVEGTIVSTYSTVFDDGHHHHHLPAWHAIAHMATAPMRWFGGLLTAATAGERRESVSDHIVSA